MKTTKITIKNLFGIRETTLDGKSVEISGPKGSGKTSVLDAIRYALTNRSDRDYIVHQGADEGEIIIETNTGLSIDRKALPAKSAGTVKVRDGSMLQTRPAEFLAQIFTPLQLDPVKFTQLSRQEKNREILNLIEFQWDMNWIKEQFGEIPQGVDYSKHILEVLNDIQAENGIYFQSRQNINRDIRNKQAFIADIAKDIPSGYDYDRWNNYPSGEKYRELERLREQNSRIERAKAFRSGYDAKLRGLEAQRDMDLAAIDSDIARERASLTGTMERLKAELKATEEKLSGMEQRRHEKADVVQSKYETATAKLEKDMGVAADYAGREPVDTTALSQELDTAEEMRKHLNEYQRMVAMQAELEDLTEQSSEFTRKIELARELPAKILETAKIPVEGLTVENGVPLIRGLPISNLSDGELLELCVDISVSKPGQLQIILVDGAERLDKALRKVYRDVDYAISKKEGSIHLHGVFSKNTVVLGSNSSPGTIAHELFHEMDADRAISSGLTLAIAQDQVSLNMASNGDIKAYLQMKYPNAVRTKKSGDIALNNPYRGIADILNGMSGGKEWYGFGHSKKYWKTPGNLEAEAWAQFGRTYYNNDPDVKKMFEDIFPNLSTHAMMALKGLI